MTRDPRRSRGVDDDDLMAEVVFRCTQHSARSTKHQAPSTKQEAPLHNSPEIPMPGTRQILRFLATPPIASTTALDSGLST